MAIRHSRPQRIPTRPPSDEIPNPSALSSNLQLCTSSQRHDKYPHSLFRVRVERRLQGSCCPKGTTSRRRPKPLKLRESLFQRVPTGAQVLAPAQRPRVRLIDSLKQVRAPFQKRRDLQRKNAHSAGNSTITRYWDFDTTECRPCRIRASGRGSCSQATGVQRSGKWIDLPIVGLYPRDCGLDLCPSWNIGRNKSDPSLSTPPRRSTLSTTLSTQGSVRPP